MEKCSLNGDNQCTQQTHAFVLNVTLNVLRGLSFSLSNDLKSERTTESYMSCPFFV